MTQLVLPSRASAAPDAIRGTAVLAETIPRWAVVTALSASASGTLRLTSLYIEAGTPVSSITYPSGTVPGGTLTHQWFCLYTGVSTAPALLAVTGDDVATAWAASTLKSLPVSRTVTDGVTATNTTLTSATAAFTAADVGKQVMIPGAGPAGALYGLSSTTRTIASVESGTSCTLSAATSHSASGETVYIQTPYTVAASGVYYVGQLQTASTLANGGGASMLVNGLYSVALLMAGTSTASLTTPATAPNPGASMGALAAINYAYIT